MVVVAQRDVQQVRAEALAELSSHVKALVRAAPEFVEQYIEATLEGRGTRPAVGPLHPCAVKLLREVSLDALHAGAGLRMGA